MKTRLDEYISKEKNISKSKAQSLILAGKVYVNDQKATKAGHFLKDDDKVEVRSALHPYVSFGGVKLEKVLNHFNIKVKDLTAMDVGASTGGFTDCLLQRGLKKSYAVDVGYGQLDWKLQQDDRVVIFDRTNIRNLEFETIGEKVDLITVDASFISLKIIVPSLIKFLKNNAKLIMLFKPQFEVGKENIEKGGIVRKHKVVERIMNEFSAFLEKNNFEIIGRVESPRQRETKNQEYLIYCKYKTHEFVIAKT